ncbi:MAG: Hsp33 family molecular chaperone HslO, partial [Verrucomicrobiales bacterium]
MAAESETDDTQPGEEPISIDSTFVRGRNVLLIEANFTPLYIDYYLHLMQHELRYPTDLDTRLKELLAYLTLHATARPWAESIAWTINLRAPRANLFATASSLGEMVVGRVFTEDIREAPNDILYSQTSVANTEPRTSTVQLDHQSPREWMETFYTSSEQRPCRCFDLGDESYAMLAAQPDADREWLAGLDADGVRAIRGDEDCKVLETRRFRFHCGCSLEKILPMLGTWRERPDELFQGAPE